MSTPTQPMPRPGVRAEIHDFVADVERALDDLPADDVAELTDGLEADLAEAWAAEGVTPVERFGSPESYATELRTAAGLPPRAARRARVMQWASAGERITSSLRAQPWWPQAVEYGHELRPAWWALRGAVLVGLAGFVVVAFLGVAPFVLIVVLLLPAMLWGAVASMRAGAADRAATERSGRLLTVANLVVVSTLLVGGYAYLASTTTDNAVIYRDDPYPTQGLNYENEQVSNVFAYDAEGKPITRFRLYDQSGRPLTVGEDARAGWDDASGSSWTSVPDSGAGPPEWNLFPLLRAVDAPADPATGEPSDQAAVEGPVAPPFAQLPALPSSTGAEDPKD